MPWKGYNYEDAIVWNERVVREDLLTSVHVENILWKFVKRNVVWKRLTSDIPNVSEEATKTWMKTGIVRIGARIEPGDIMIGKITPKVNLILLRKKNCFVQSSVIRLVM